MNQGRTIFAQLMDHLPHKEFAVCMDRYRGERYVKRFSCMDQFLCMAFAQLAYRESLRDIECRLRAHPTKLYHMGIRGRASKSTLAHANEHRDWRIWADLAQVLIPRSLSDLISSSIKKGTPSVFSRISSSSAGSTSGASMR